MIKKTQGLTDIFKRFLYFGKYVYLTYALKSFEIEGLNKSESFLKLRASFSIWKDVDMILVLFYGSLCITSKFNVYRLKLSEVLQKCCKSVVCNHCYIIVIQCESIFIMMTIYYVYYENRLNYFCPTLDSCLSLNKNNTKMFT